MQHMWVHIRTYLENKGFTIGMQNKAPLFFDPKRRTMLVRQTGTEYIEKT